MYKNIKQWTLWFERVKSMHIEKNRTTKETNIQVSLNFSFGDVSVQTPTPFFTHMLHALLFHGGWSGTIKAAGDTEVDDHHLVEDVGIVLGTVFSEYAFHQQPTARFGHAVIPMDDALAECTVDFSNRPYLYYDVMFPQPRSGTFDMSLGREFFYAMAMNAKINLHLTARYGMNSHHILEALFKACGRAVFVSLQPSLRNDVQSTKGVL